MNSELLKVRVTAFIYEAGSMFGFALLGVLTSDEFTQLITNYLGETIYGAVALLALNALVKHIRNLKALKKYNHGMGAFGSQNRFGSSAKPTLI